MFYPIFRFIENTCSKLEAQLGQTMGIVYALISATCLFFLGLYAKLISDHIGYSQISLFRSLYMAIFMKFLIDYSKDNVVPELPYIRTTMLIRNICGFFFNLVYLIG